MRSLTVAMFVCAVAACAPTMRTTMIGAERAPAAEPGEILVFSSKVPECPYDEIALVTAKRGEFDLVGKGDLLSTLKQRAHELGGHAIVGLAELPRTEVEGPSLSGTVVRFKSSDCRLDRA